METELQSLVLRQLTDMSEAELQSQIVEPLLRKLGFRNVQVNSGANERGKDLVSVKVDEFGHPLLYAIQLKKGSVAQSVGRICGKCMPLRPASLSLDLDNGSPHEAQPSHKEEAPF